MTLEWQDITALASVALAGGYLARRVWMQLICKPSGGCGGCSSCAQGTSQSELPIVKIDTNREIR